MDSPTFEHDPIKVYQFFSKILSIIYYIQKYVQVYDQGRLEENWDGTEDDDDDNEFQLNEKYFFKTTKLSDNKTSEDDDGKQYRHILRFYQDQLNQCYSRSCKLVIT